MGLLQEIYGEIRDVVLGQGGVVDAVLPPIIFVIVQTLWDFSAAMWIALLIALAIGIIRIIRGQNVLYALGGALGVLLAIGLTRLLGGEQNFFLPGLLSSALTAFLCFVSVIAKRPLVAWTSLIARRWPKEWYWHPGVRPAYAEVTVFWGLYFVFRFAAQWYFFQGGSASRLAWLNLFLGWPATLVLLIGSYIYGTTRLRSLGGPSVEEYKRDADPPWESQRRGF